MGEIKGIGIVVEYNPFHNGHLVHLEAAQDNKEDNVIIAVMSGNFLQRGEPGVVDKWTRARMALENGVDIVLELPVYFSNQSAELFAHGSIDILNKLLVEKVVFGSESSDQEVLEEIARLQIEESEKVGELVKKELEKGISYPNAINNVVENLLGKKDILKPNDILGIEYIKSIKRLKANMHPQVIKRKKVGYYELGRKEEIASATSIRKMGFKREFHEIERVVPKKNYNLLREKIEEGKLIQLRDFYPLLRYEILSNYNSLKDIVDMEIGLENRIYKSAQKNENYNDFYQGIMTKRYTNGRIQRVLSHILLKLDKNLLEKVQGKVTYVKILAISPKGQRYLKEKKEEIGEKIKILSGLKNVSLKLDERENELLNFELKCDAIYNIVSPYKGEKFPIRKKGDEKNSEGK